MVLLCAIKMKNKINNLSLLLHTMTMCMCCKTYLLKGEFIRIK